MLIKIGGNMRRSHFDIFLCTALASPAWAGDIPRYEPNNAEPEKGQA
jgi:hypothetical protein